MRDNVVVQWIVLGLSVVAFILILKLGASYLPEGGVTGAFKRVLGSL
jgi:hypothetical protein